MRPADEVFCSHVCELFELGGREVREVGRVGEDAGAEGGELGWQVPDEEDAEGCGTERRDKGVKSNVP